MPPGLRTLTAPQRELADFLRVDEELLAFAAEASPPLEKAIDDPAGLASWVATLPETEKDRLLLRVAQGDGATVRLELLRRFRDETAPAAACPPRRAVRELLDGAARWHAERKRREAAERAEEQARRERDEALTRERRLDELSRDEEAAWTRVDAMIATRTPDGYDTAVTLLTDLRALAERANQPKEFTRRCTALRQAHARKTTLIARMNRAKL
ncbi:hypothetical protein [Actinophytocola sp.]|uniref:hypothetical protein n=1 Tax=Actinophytocola sp. TaxID=1872138 RepID=UPI002ED6694E